jgi:hypothetical protein
VPCCPERIGSRAGSHPAEGEIREEIIQHYGGACACCGETEPLFLQIDHVNNDGAADREEHGRTGPYVWIRDNDYPEGYQVMCAKPSHEVRVLSHSW